METFQFKIRNFFKKNFEASNYRLALKLAHDWRDTYAPGGSVEFIGKKVSE